MDAACLACVLFSLPALELHPALKACFIAEDSAPCVRHKFFCSFLVAQPLLCIVGKLPPDHLVNAFKSLALCQKFQCMLLQCLRTLCIQ